MTSSRTLFLILLFAAFGNALAQGREAPYVKDEVLVKFDRRASASLRSGAHRLSGSQRLKVLGDLGWERVRIAPGQTVEEAIKRYSKNPNVRHVQPNYYYQLAVTPDDPQFQNLYGLSKISAPAAWDITTGSRDVIVANIDTGMRLTHEDLAANIWTNPGEIADNGIDDDNNGYIDDVHGWDFRYDDNDPTDQNGHGTHVAGTIGAAGNNGIGVVGVNWAVTIMAIKIYSPSGGDTTSAMLINAYNYVRMMKERGVNIRVTNNSYGGCQEACGYDQATRDAIEAMGDAGILNVFAAGNGGVNIDNSPFYPASYTLSSILSVGGSNSLDNRVFNYGAESVDLAAPGVGILSTTNGSNSSYGNSSGTSMSTPHVSGAAALVAAQYPEMSVASLKATLMNSVDKLPQFDGFNRTGGRLNLFGALTAPTVCDFNLSTKSIDVPTKGGIFEIVVEAPANCEFSAKSDAIWVRVLNTGSRSGTGTVSLQIAVNPTITRSATVDIAGQQITVIQYRMRGN